MVGPITCPGFRILGPFMFGSPKRTTALGERNGLPVSAFLLKKPVSRPMGV